MAGAAAVGAMLMGAEAVVPMPVAPNPPTEPYLMRITVSGDPRMSGVFENCADPATIRKTAQARAKARPADAPSPMAGCSHTREMRPEGSVHMETSCDRAKGARASFRMTTDGTPNDLHTHTETYGFDSVTGAPKTTVRDSHVVRLGSCPAELKPGQMRRPGGPVIDISGDMARLLEGARGTPP
jgi:hypothetical protein